MTQALILKKAIEAIEADKIAEVSELLASHDEIPTQETISTILISAANYRRWAIVDEICLMEGENKPSEPAISSALSAAYCCDVLPSFKLICEQSKTPPSQETIDIFLTDAIEKSYNKDMVKFYRNYWNFIGYLCFLSTKNKPSRLVIDKALKEAASNHGWKLVNKLCQLEGENKPSEPAIAYALSRACSNNAFEQFQQIIEHSKTPPSQKTIENLLSEAIKAIERPDKKYWVYIDYLCFLSTNNKPSAQGISRALISAANYGKWELVSKLLQLTGDNQPNQASIEYVLLQASSFNNARIVQDISSIPGDRCPRSEANNNALVSAAKYGALDIVRFYCDSQLEMENKPTSEAFDDSFIQAATANQVKVVEYYYHDQLFINSQDLIGKALTAAATNGSLLVVQFLCNDKNFKPTQSDVDASFLAGVSAGKTKIAEYFMNPENGIALDQQTIDTALLDLIKANKLTGIEILVESNSIRKASQEGIQAALLEANTQMARDYLTKYLIKPVSYVEQVKDNPVIFVSNSVNVDAHIAKSPDNIKQQVNQDDDALSQEISSSFLISCSEFYQDNENLILGLIIAAAVLLLIVSCATLGVGACGFAAAGTLAATIASTLFITTQTAAIVATSVGGGVAVGAASGLIGLSIFTAKKESKGGDDFNANFSYVI